MPNFDVLVLAAGKSTRIAAVAQGLPKPLLKIQGQSILEHNLKWLARSGVREVWINLHHEPEQIRQVIGTGGAVGLKVQYSYEPEILGTAGAYKNLEKHFRLTTLIVYGDNVLSFDLEAFSKAHVATKAAATVALFDQNVHAHTGIAGGSVVMDEAERITRFAESTGTVSTRVNAGVYLLEPSVLKLIPSGAFSDFGKDIFPTMQSAGSLYGYVIDKNGYCLGLDRPENLEKGLELIQTGRVKLQ